MAGFMKESHKVVRLIACAVFKPALEYLQLKKRYPDLRVTYLPSHLHLKPQELQKRLLKEIIKARKGGERIICLYGYCFPDIDDFCKRHEVTKVPGHYCYEMLLGPDRFSQLISDIAGTYFVEQDVIQNFEAYCMKPLELRDEEMRRYCFEHYKRVLYVRQPEDAELESKACDIADFLDLYMDVSDADYSYLEDQLTELI
jgi:hypothetical protein